MKSVVAVLVVLFCHDTRRTKKLTCREHRVKLVSYIVALMDKSWLIIIINCRCFGKKYLLPLVSNRHFHYEEPWAVIVGSEL